VQNSTILEEIDGLPSFVEKLDRIALPNQLISALDDPLLRKYIMLLGSDIPIERIDDWLSLFFDSQVQIHRDTGEMSKALIEVLEKLRDYVRYTKVREI
jgi:centromere protein I